MHMISEDLSSRLTRWMGIPARIQLKTIQLPLLIVLINYVLMEVPLKICESYIVIVYIRLDEQERALVGYTHYYNYASIPINNYVIVV